MKKARVGRIGVLAVLVLGWTAAPSAAKAPDPDRRSVTDLLRARIEWVARKGVVPMSVGRIRAVNALAAFYERRLYEPAWSSSHRPVAMAGPLVRLLGEAELEGLLGEDYHVAEIRELLGAIRGGSSSPPALADFDLLMTDAFLLYGAHMVSGRVDPETFDPEWIAVRREVDLVALLERALEDGRPAEALRELAPAAAGYALLRDALARYREAARDGGWPAVPEGPGLGREPRKTAPSTAEAAEPERLRALRSRLRATGDLAGESPAPDVFDEELDAAVKRFQSRHGLDPDGVVGAKTLAALNVPAEARARQIELNLERWRWLPRDLGGRYVLVNIPEYSLRVVEDERPVLEMRAIVGRPFRRTPVFSDVMRYLVLNPFWEVPLKLAVEDKIPEIRRDPEYFTRMGIRVYDGWGSERDEIDPYALDWKSLGRGNFPYRLRQDPGPLNALGRIKFMFPNRFNVYLHDTPARELFKHVDRAQSSGCIRVEKPLELAEYLLAGAGWDQGRLVRALETESDRTVNLLQPVAVHLQYWTAWTDDAGAVHFRADLYGRDDNLAAALAARSLETPSEPRVSGRAF